LAEILQVKALGHALCVCGPVEVPGVTEVFDLVKMRMSTE